ncbi:MAG: family 10 glycosylhydrolase, partial [Clostridia bacterium]|nr:family 10 glycosylhydrolase [Clostridia bacterium]
VRGTQGVGPADGFDPLEYAVEKAHACGMELHAWINPLRIQAVGGSTPPALSADNPYTKLRTDGDKANDRWVIDYDGGKFFNPGEEGARKYIIDGIAEIVENYDVDGIHWDDYFYPAHDSTFDDSASYSKYVDAGGLMSLSEWRTSNINKLVADTYSRVKSIKSDCVFGISPAGNISNCLKMGANVYTWCSEPGFVDYICPQIYWTFDGNPLGFASCCSQWKAMVTAENIDFYVGLALYKAGSDADGGKWLSGNDIIARQIEHIRSNGIDADGFMLYSYAYLKSEQTAKEMENVRKLLG